MSVGAETLPRAGVGYDYEPSHATLAVAEVLLFDDGGRILTFEEDTRSPFELDGVQLPRTFVNLTAGEPLSAGAQRAAAERTDTTLWVTDLTLCFKGLTEVHMAKSSDDLTTRYCAFAAIIPPTVSAQNSDTGRWATMQEVAESSRLYESVMRQICFEGLTLRRWTRGGIRTLPIA